MNRSYVIQQIIGKKQAQTYLEIGVNDARNFFRIKARRKIAVDPKFRFPLSQKIKWSLKNICNLSAEWHECTSDSYFANKQSKERFDVVFIDGLHTFEQALKDVDNALTHLSEGGVIVLHDCNPPHASAAIPAEDFNSVVRMELPGWTGEWCGDVWKTICYLRAQRKNLHAFVLDCDYGIGIVTKGGSGESLPLSKEEIVNMTYEQLAKNRKALLGLKEEKYFHEFLESID